jgi:hypothetical protein
MKLALAFALLSGGCFTGRIGGGGHVATSGARGIDVPLSIGVGAPVARDRAVYASSGLAASTGSETPIVAFGRIDYVDHAGEYPWSAGVRGGGRFAGATDPDADPPETAAPTEGFYGVSVGIYAVIKQPADTPYPEHSGEPTLGDAVAHIPPPIAGWGVIGAELDVDAVQTEGVVLTLDIVLGFDTLTGHYESE